MHIYVTPVLLPNYEGAPPEVLAMNGFTLGRQYLATPFIDNGRLGMVRNDDGHVMIVPLNGEPTAHILCTRDPRWRWPDLFPKPAGYFEVEHSVRRKS